MIPVLIMFCLHVYSWLNRINVLNNFYEYTVRINVTNISLEHLSWELFYIIAIHTSLYEPFYRIFIFYQ